MDKDKTDQKRDADGNWVSDLKPGATQAAKQDKRLEDTFPASDPAVKSGTTGFVAPDGTEMAVEGPGKAAARSATEDLPKQG